jgi:hypothetical protein
MVWARRKSEGGKIPRNGQTRENTEEEAQKKKMTNLEGRDRAGCEGKRN